MGLSSFALVAGEMIAGRRGLGYMIFDAYNMAQIPTIIMGMLTLGLLGWASSALVRRLGRALMVWRGGWRPWGRRAGPPAAGGAGGGARGRRGSLAALV